MLKTGGPKRCQSYPLIRFERVLFSSFEILVQIQCSKHPYAVAYHAFHIRPAKSDYKWPGILICAHQRRALREKHENSKHRVDKMFGCQMPQNCRRTGTMFHSMIWIRSSRDCSEGGGGVTTFLVHLFSCENWEPPQTDTCVKVLTLGFTEAKKNPRSHE